MRIVAASWLVALVLLPPAARADVAAPAPAPPPPTRPLPRLEYTAPLVDATPKGTAAEVDADWRYTEYDKGMEVSTVDGARAVHIAEVLAPAIVDGRHDRWYRADGGEKYFGAALTPLAFTVDGIPVTVAFGADFQIHVRAAGHDLVLEPAGQAYLSRRGGDVSARLVTGAVGGVPLILVSSRPEACSDFWDVYVSVVGGVPKKALELGGVADPPVSETRSVKFDARARTATVKVVTQEDELAKPKVKIERWRWQTDAFVKLR